MVPKKVPKWTPKSIRGVPEGAHSGKRPILQTTPRRGRAGEMLPRGFLAFWFFFGLLGVQKGVHFTNGDFTCLLFFSPRSRNYFWIHFGQVGVDLGGRLEVVLGSMFAASPWQHPCGNLAKTLHKNLQTPWATPPARTNPEGAAVSRQRPQFAVPTGYWRVKPNPGSSREGRNPAVPGGFPSLPPRQPPQDRRTLARMRTRRPFFARFFLFLASGRFSAFSQKSPPCRNFRNRPRSGFGASRGPCCAIPGGPGRLFRTPRGP